ncbi:MAG: hypothetical protein JF595_17850 [Sphingomonadales bacterium]|nr:hypothetical protein [Sphingomonadales bacterium]
MKTAAILLAPIALTSVLATAAPPAAAPGVTLARLGETVRIHGVRVTPLRLVEDSRCPARVTCVWAGRVRIVARIGGAARELTLGQPVPMAGGTLQLAAVMPQRQRIGTIPPAAYRFGFRFDGNSGMQLIRD